jgi:hypothetical protein
MPVPVIGAPNWSTTLAESWRDIPIPSTSRWGVTMSVLVGVGDVMSSEPQAAAAVPMSALAKLERSTAESVFTGPPWASLPSYTLSFWPVT